MSMLRFVLRKISVLHNSLIKYRFAIKSDRGSSLFQRIALQMEKLRLDQAGCSKSWNIIICVLYIVTLPVVIILVCAVSLFFLLILLLHLFIACCFIACFFKKKKNRKNKRRTGAGEEAGEEAGEAGEEGKRGRSRSAKKMPSYQNEQETSENCWKTICSIPFSINECNGQANFFLYQENLNMEDVPELAELICKLDNCQIELSCKDDDILKSEEKRRIWIVKEIVRIACEELNYEFEFDENKKEIVIRSIQNFRTKIYIYYDMNDERVIMPCKDKTYIVCEFE